MAGFSFPEFLAKTGLSISRLATYLQVAESYLEAAAAGAMRLTARDQHACRLLWRRLFAAKQLELPLSSSPEALTRAYARRRRREHAAGTTGSSRGRVRRSLASSDRTSDQKGSRP